MPSWCLIPERVQAFKQALVDKTIDPQKLAQMTSEERHSAISKVVGEDNATQVNSLFEKNLLLKNHQKAYIDWAKKVSGMTPQARQDLITRISKMDKILNPEEEKAFLKDLATTRLKVGVSPEEAKNIFDLSKKIQEGKSKADENGVFTSKTDQLEYGAAHVMLSDYLGELKANANKYGVKDYLKNPTKIPADAISTVAGATKSVLSSLDDSFFGRQGIKTLLDLRTSPIWVKNFAKSWGDIGKELVGHDAMTPIKVDIASRPNALNGKYKAAGVDLGGFGEEAFPSSLPEKIPLLGRLFKASESAFNGAALRMRADLADRLITKAEKYGVNTADPKQAGDIGRLVNSLTGRGSLGKAEVLSKEANLLLFSVKFLKSNIDTLTMPFQTGVSGFARKEAAKNLLSIATTLAGVNVLAGMLDPNSVEKDPRSNNFGKIKINGQWTDISGGLAGLAHLGAQLVPTQHNGEWGFYSKNASTGIVNKLNSGEFGASTALDVFDSFWQGKLSPVAGIVRDIWKGSNYAGEAPTAGNVAKDVVTPLPVQSYNNLANDPNSTNVLGSMILDGLGFSVSSKPANNSQNDWSITPTKEEQQFLDTVGNDKFKQANQEFNKEYKDWVKQTISNPDYGQLSDDAKKNLLQTGKSDIQKKIFSNYNFEYEKNKSDQQLQEKDIINNLRPQSSIQDHENLVQSILDTLIPVAHASNGNETQRPSITDSLKGLAENVGEDIGNFGGAQLNIAKDNAVELGKAIADKLFHNQPTISPENGYMSMDIKDEPKPMKAPASDSISSQPTPNPPASSTSNKIDFSQFKNNQDSAFRKGFTPSPPPAEIADIIKKYFPDNYSQAVLVAATENAQYDPKRPDNINTKDGSHDRGIFQINSDTFNSWQQKAGDKLRAAGINSYDDMYDPEKNAFMARLIQQGAKQWNNSQGFNTNGWSGWFGWQDTGYNLDNGWYSAPKRVAYETGKSNQKDELSNNPRDVLESQPEWAQKTTNFLANTRAHQASLNDRFNRSAAEVNNAKILEPQLKKD
jgi:hypothetical protein